MIDKDEPAVTRHGLRRQTLRDWRDEKGKTMQRLAEEAKMSLSALDSLENGRTQPTVEVASRLTEVLDVYIEQVIWLKPGGLSRPPTKLFRTFDANVQMVMAQAVFRIANYNEQLPEVLAWLRRELNALRRPTEEIDAAIARVEEVVVEDSYRKGAKALETVIRHALTSRPEVARKLSVQGIVEPRGDNPRWGVRLLETYPGNLPVDVYSEPEWHELLLKMLIPGQ